MLCNMRGDQKSIGNSQLTAISYRLIHDEQFAIIVVESIKKEKKRDVLTRLPPDRYQLA
jgi:hypothetical protein